MTYIFDPQQHKFGMAYMLHDGTIHIPLEKPVRQTICRSYSPNKPGKIGFDTSLKLTRAPEHDLIPKADVAPLVKILDVVDAVFIRIDDDCYQIDHKTFDTMRKALSDFQQKHGAL